MAEATFSSRYQRHPGLILGFHGTDLQVVKDVVERRLEHLARSERVYDWLGHGVYFWEDDPERALRWARDGHSSNAITTPAVLGAVIDLGLCLDLSTELGRVEVISAYRTLAAATKAAQTMLPKNSLGPDAVLRELDCEVIEVLHQTRKDRGEPPYDTVRGLFHEGGRLYPGSGFHQLTHVQIAVLNTDCIKGYFQPIPERSVRISSGHPTAARRAREAR